MILVLILWLLWTPDREAVVVTWLNEIEVQAHNLTHKVKTEPGFSGDATDSSRSAAASPVATPAWNQVPAGSTSLRSAYRPLAVPGQGDARGLSSRSGLPESSEKATRTAFHAQARPQTPDGLVLAGSGLPARVTIVSSTIPAAGSEASKASHVRWTIAPNTTTERRWTLNSPGWAASLMEEDLWGFGAAAELSSDVATETARTVIYYRERQFEQTRIIMEGQ